MYDIIATLELKIVFVYDCCFVGEECVQHDSQRRQKEVHQLLGRSGKWQRSRRFESLKNKYMNE